MLSNKLLLGLQQGTTTTTTTTILPEGVSFDGSTDYLSRSSDLVGNVDSKTFTFSCWVYPDVVTYNWFSGYETGARNNTSVNRVVLRVNQDRSYKILVWNSQETIILNAYTSPFSVPRNTWSNIIVSLDSSNSANRNVYINDTLASVTWATYTDTLLPFSQNNKHSVGIDSHYSERVDGKQRLSHLFLDYTYRDLSIEANRRLFITADGKPASGLETLNPILYLPMKDKATAHINLGTGGDFVQNGLIETADRGANQDNCKASLFDGSDDSLVNTSISFGSAGDVAIVAFSISCPSTSSSIFGLQSTNNDTTYPRMRFYGDSSDYLRWLIEDSTGINLNLTLNNTQIPLDRVLNVAISIDMADNLKTKVYINGLDYTDITQTHNGRAIDWPAFVTMFIGKDYGANTSTDQTIGELYFDTNYIDLATNNPFWDSDTNKPIPVRTAMANLGSNPLICMPIDASNPTKNYGSGGDFVLNGGGLTGARGASEEITRSIVVDATNYLTGNITCASLVKWVSTDSGTTWTVSYTNNETVTSIGNGINNGMVAYYLGFSDVIDWTLESNKNMVTNQLGYPRAFSDVVKDSGWTPVLGLGFKDTSNFGLNDYGADYVMTGVITAGADVAI